jgi:hypothetical protein
MSIEREALQPFHLAVPITHAALVEWLSGLPEARRAAEVESTLIAGHLILNLVQAAAGEEQMARFFRPVVDKMDELQGRLTELIHSSQKSKRLGDIGEEIVCKQLADAFPADQFRIVSTRGHEADIEAIFTLAPDVTREARVEVKLHTDDVRGDELEKFRSDLDSTGVRYGLMVSLASRLATVRGAMKIEETEGYTAIFVSRSGLDGVNLISAAALLKAIMAYHARSESARRIPAAAIEQAWRSISDEIETLREVGREVRDFRDSVRKVEQLLIAQLGALADRANTADVKLAAAVDRLVQQLHDELDALPAASEALSLPPASTPDEVLAALDRLEESDPKRARVFRGLREIAMGCDLAVAIDAEGEWIFQRNGQALARTATMKNQVDAIFPLTTTNEPVTIIPELEMIKKSQVIVKGKDVEAMLRRVKERLTACEVAGPVTD